jgi:hypothetical protein
MPETICLYIDDQPEDWSTGVGNPVADAFKAQYPHARLRIHGVDFDEGERRIREGEAGRYDLILIDIFDKSGTTPRTRGYGLIELAVEMTDAAVIAISAEEAAVTDAERTSAHGWISKPRISEANGRQYLKARLADAVRVRGLYIRPLHDFEVDYQHSDLRLEAVISSIGEDRLSALVASLCDATLTGLTVEYVRAGLSGASVMNCLCTTDTGQRRLLVKASRDGHKMEREAEAWGRVNEFGQVPFPGNLVKDSVVNAGGWYGLATTFHAGKTLTDWLAGPRAVATSGGEDAERLVRQLFSAEMFPEAYASTAQFGKKLQPSEVVRDDLLGINRRARVRIAMDELRPLLTVEKHRIAGGAEAFRTVERFLQSGVVGGLDVEDLPAGAWRVRSHGDLHGRNVLVQPEVTAKVLDPADARMQHWAGDWSRLIVDMFLSGLATSTDSYDFASMAVWRDASGTIVRDETAGDAPLVSTAIHAAIGWLRSNAATIFGRIDPALPTEWELRLALGVELLRGSYRREELAPPLRLLGLLAGADALHAAAEAVEA